MSMQGVWCRYGFLPQTLGEDQDPLVRSTHCSSSTLMLAADAMHIRHYCLRAHNLSERRTTVSAWSCVVFASSRASVCISAHVLSGKCTCVEEAILHAVVRHAHVCMLMAAAFDCAPVGCAACYAAEGWSCCNSLTLKGAIYSR